MNLRTTNNRRRLKARARRAMMGYEVSKGCYTFTIWYNNNKQARFVFRENPDWVMAE